MMHWVLIIIRLKRIEKNLSQEYVATHIRISQTSYARIESGKTALKLEILFKILKVLGIDYFDFFDLVKENEERKKINKI